MLEVVIRSNHDPPPLTRGSQVFLGHPLGTPQERVAFLGGKRMPWSELAWLPEAGTDLQVLVRVFRLLEGP